ncbi:hypothetical protein LEMLEM_LOCUS4440 [Lemmus lemmus]
MCCLYPFVSLLHQEIGSGLSSRNVQALHWCLIFSLHPGSHLSQEKRTLL